MSLLTKYRPKTLDQVIGNKGLVNKLKPILSREEDCPNAFLLHGPPGCGKTTIGRIIANSLQCCGADLKEVDSADYTGIDSIREIRKNMRYKPMQCPYRIWLLDEVHRMSAQAQDALLKALEEPPAHVKFILCTTDPQQIRPAVKRRCSMLEVNPVTEREILVLLTKVAKWEEKEIPKEVRQQISEESLGQPGIALQVLDAIIDLEPEEMLKQAHHETAAKNQAIELCRALLKAASWKQIAGILKELQDQNEESIRRMVLGYCNSVLLKGGDSNAFAVMDEFIDPFYNSGKPGLTWASYRASQK